MRLTNYDSASARLVYSLLLAAPFAIGALAASAAVVWSSRGRDWMLGLLLLGVSVLFFSLAFIHLRAVVFHVELEPGGVCVLELTGRRLYAWSDIETFDFSERCPEVKGIPLKPLTYVMMTLVLREGRRLEVQVSEREAQEAARFIQQVRHPA
jgi:hypothetical protein